MREKIIGLALAALVGMSIFWGVSVAQAADISEAVYSGVVRCSNNSSTAKTAVSGAVGFNTTAMIASSIVASNGSDIVLQQSGESQAIFMPGPGYLAVYCGDINANANNDNTLYATNVSGGDIRYIPGLTGLSVNHSNTMPDGTTNFSMNITGMLDANANGVLFGQPGTWTATFNGSDNSVNFTSATYDFTDDFDTDDWTDVGSKIKVDAVTDERLEFESERSVTDTRTYIDVLGATIDNANWRLDLALHVTTSTDAGAEFVFGMWSHTQNENAYANDALLFRVAGTDPTIFTKAYDSGGSTTGSSITIANGVTYYVTLAREDTNTLTLEVYSDSGRTTHVSGSPQDHDITAASITSLRYMQGSNANSGSGAAKEQIGWIDDIGFTDGTTGAGVTFAATATPGYGTFVLMADDSRIRFYDRDGQDTGNVTVGTGIPHSTRDYQFGANHTFDYIDSVSVFRGGNIKGSWAWEWGANWTDASGEGNTGYPSHKEVTAEADVTVSLVSFGPITYATTTGDAAVTWPSPSGGTPPATPSTAYTENSSPGIFFAGLVEAVWSLSGLPNSVFWYIWSFSIIIMGGQVTFMVFAAKGQQALFAKIIVMGTLMTVFALPGVNIYGMYVLIYFALWGVGVLILSKSLGW